MLVFEPTPENPIVEIEIDKEIVFREETDEQNFKGYLHANVKAIHRSVRDGYFEILKDIKIPEGDNYLCEEYESQHEWEEHRLTFCEDLDSFTAMSERMRKLVNGREHRVLEYWRQYQVILQKK